ncbi:MAG TPA: hypothetical protein VN829_16080 [Dongiaceae bacterium]|nr:hypothetical protein [Dongiaceae bacterium]
MPHADIQTLLREQQGVLSPQEARELAEHLSLCRECAGRAKALRRLREDLSVGREPLPLGELIRQAQRLFPRKRRVSGLGRLWAFFRLRLGGVAEALLALFRVSMGRAALTPVSPETKGKALFRVSMGRPALLGACAVVVVGFGLLLLWARPGPRILVRLSDTSGTIALTDHNALVWPRQTGLPAWCAARAAELLSGRAVAPAPGFAGVLDQLQPASAVLSGPGEQQVKPVLLSPACTVVRSAPPWFRWRGVTGATNYQFLLSRASDTSLMADIPAGVVTNFSWPAARRDLRPGETYAWQIEASVRSGTKISVPARFYVLNASELSELDGTEKLCRRSAVMMLALHESWGLWDEAVRDLEAVRGLNPGSDAVSRIGKELAHRRGGGEGVPSDTGGL